MASDTRRRGAMHACKGCRTATITCNARLLLHADLVSSLRLAVMLDAIKVKDCTRCNDAMQSGCIGAMQRDTRVQHLRPNPTDGCNASNRAISLGKVAEPMQSKTHAYAAFGMSEALVYDLSSDGKYPQRNRRRLLPCRGGSTAPTGPAP